MSETEADVRLQGSATLPDGSVLFDKIDLSLHQKGWTCLLGPSGCGKSTLLRLLAGLPTGVRFEGEIQSAGLDRIAFMAQSDLLMPWLNVRSNIALGARLRGEPVDRDRVADLLARLGLQGTADRRPSTLSGGQRQRVALARTLMEDRPIVLLDEPFSALDARTRADMHELAAETLAGRTVLIVTHDPAEAARLGNRILLMTEGALRRIDVPDNTTIRAVDDATVLALQTDLLQRLRAAG